MVVHRQEKLASHPVHLGLVVPVLCFVGHTDCLCELPQSILRLLYIAVGICQ
jgi:hypothetical protein